jgi:hypothetical protein
MPDVDLEATIRAFVANAPRVKALCNKRVYAALNLELPEGYDVVQGPALVISIRGGGANAHAPLIYTRGATGPTNAPPGRSIGRSSRHCIPRSLARSRWRC